MLLCLQFAVMIKVGAPFALPALAMHPWRYAFSRAFRILVRAMLASNAIPEPMSKETGSDHPRWGASVA